jgi:hypothetical protein
LHFRALRLLWNSKLPELLFRLSGENLALVQCCEGH